MLKRFSLVWALSLVVCLSLVAQQAPPPQPLTIWYDYYVKDGQWDNFNLLVKTVGAPVRDKLMAEGVVHAWGIEVPLMRRPGAPNVTIWASVSDWAGVEKVQKGMEAQLAKLAEEEAKARKKTTMQIARETFDDSKTRDWLTRDILFNASDKVPKDALPYTRYFFLKVKPGKGDDFRKLSERMATSRTMPGWPATAWRTGTRSARPSWPVGRPVRKRSGRPSPGTSTTWWKGTHPVA
jgi:hypothetical protein